MKKYLNRIFSQKIGRSLKNHRLGIILCFIFALLIGYGYRYYRYILNIEVVSVTAMDEFYNEADMYHRYLFAMKRVFDTQRHYARAEKQMLENRPTPPIVSPKRKRHNVVVIIGESLRRLDMHCYGYPLENTPHIDSLVRQGSLWLYDDVVTIAPNTVQALRRVLTLRDRKDEDKPWDETTSLPIAFKSAGYLTYWCSNQEPNGIWIEEVSTIARTSDTLAYVERIQNNYAFFWGADKSPYDEALFPFLMDYRALSSDENLFTIVHLIGSHYSYKDRYPQSWSRFSGKDIEEAHLNEEQAEISATYMNSILYNDWVVSEIMKYYSKTSSIVIYLSDHGEGRYDDPDDLGFCGHTCTKNSMQIPLMVYMSDSFKKENPDIVELVKAGVHRPFMSDYFSTSLVSLMGIKSQYTNPSRELWSPSFDSKRPRHLEMWGSELIFEPRYPEYR